MIRREPRTAFASPTLLPALALTRRDARGARRNSMAARSPSCSKIHTCGCGNEIACQTAGDHLTHEYECREAHA